MSFFACHRNVSPSCMTQNSSAVECSGEMVLGEGASVAGSILRVGLHLLPATVTWLMGCSPFL